MRTKRSGRRTRLKPEVQERVLTAIRAGNHAHVAAEYAGISASTLYRWLQRGEASRRGAYREFVEAVRKAERESEVRAVAMLQRHMEESWQAAMTYLERKYPERWGRRDRLSVEVEPRKALAEMLSLGEEDLKAAVEVAARER